MSCIILRRLEIPKPVLLQTVYVLPCYHILHIEWKSGGGGGGA